MRLFLGIVIMAATWGFVPAASAVAPFLPALDVVNAPDQFALMPHAVFLEDATAALMVEDVASGRVDQAFQTTEHTRPALGFTRSAFWVKFVVKNTSDAPRTWILENAYATLDHVTLYAPRGNGSFDVFETGDRVPFALRAITYRNPTFRLTEPGHSERAYFIRVESQGSVFLPFIAWHEHAFEQRVVIDTMMNGFVLGGLVVLFLYNLFLFASARDRGYLLYCAYIVAAAFTQEGLMGTAFQFLWPDLPQVNSGFMPAAVGISVIFANFFSIDFLQLESRSLQRRILNGISWLMAAIIASTWVVDYNFAMRPCIFLVLIWTVTLLIVGIVRFRAGFHPAIFYIGAWTFLFVGVDIAGLASSGFIDGSLISEWSTSIGTTLEGVLLSFALADKINHTRREVARSQQLLNQELRDQERIRTAFLHNTSHELRTPLNGILGFLDLLLEGRYAGLGPAARIQVEKCRLLADALRHQVNTILAIAKFKAGRLTAINGPFRLDRFVQDVAVLGEGLVLVKPGTSFALTSAWRQGAGGDFISDRDKLFTVLRNLIGNAVKFKDPRRDNAVTVNLALKDGALVATVRDTGIGIATSEQGRIFDDFRQVQVDSRRAYEGTGLGLSLARDLVSLMGGSVAVASEPTVGTCFTLTIPAAVATEGIVREEEPVSPLRLQPQPVEAMGQNYPRDVAPVSPVKTGAHDPAVRASVRGKTILVVDDHELNCEVARDILVEEGFNVRIALGGREALEDIAAARPDLVVLDLMMPEVSGEDVLRTLRAKEQWSDLPVILLTARASEDDRLFGLGLGADDYMAKPFHRRELVLRVENILTRIELTRTRAQQEQIIVLEKKLSLGVMAGGIAHEINNPLAIINGYVNNLQTMLEAPEQDAPMIARSFTRIQEAVKRIVNIVQGLLVIAGEAPVNDVGEEDPADIVSLVANFTRERLASRNITLVTACDHGDARIICDAGKLAQALMSLVGNAADALEDAQVKEVRLTTSGDGSNVVFSIEDSGVGITEEIAARVFDPFFTTKDVGKGMGLGLGIARSLVEGQGGTLGLASREPARFAVTLRRVESGKVKQLA